jgi:hypothetical protein
MSEFSCLCPWNLVIDKFVLGFEKKKFLLGKSLNLNFSLRILSAFLNIKVKSNLSCPDYYLLIKNNKSLLSKVQNGDKYSEKNKKGSLSTADNDGKSDCTVDQKSP